jgi:hypothetical protein
VPAHRTVGAERGAGWIHAAVVRLARDPFPYFLACLWIGLLNALPLAGLLVGLAMPLFHAGLLGALRNRDAGGRVRVGDAFAAFVEPGALRRLLPIVAVHAAFVLLVAGVLVAAAWPALEPLMQASATGAPPKPELVAAVLERLALPALALMPLSVWLGWVLMLAVPRAMLDGVRGGTALREAMAAVGANLGAFAINLLCLVALLSVLFIGLALVAAMVEAVALAAPPLGGVLRTLVLAGFTAVLVGLQAALMFQASREVFPGAPGTAPAPPPIGEIEA